MGEKKFWSAKKIMIIIISCILIGATVTGVAVFLKDRGQAEAVSDGNQVENLPGTGNDGENANTPGENAADGENGEVVKPETPGTEGTTSGGSTSSSSGTSSSGASSTQPGIGGAEEDEIIAGITETTVTQERKVFEDLKLSWTTIAIPTVTTNMGIYKPELKIEKTATGLIRKDTTETTELKENEEIPEVNEGDLIIYTIKVANTGNYKATNVSVVETLDVIFNDKEIKAGENVVTIETLEPGKQATLKVAYEVTKEDIENRENIYNLAYATDGKDEVESYDDDIPVAPEKIEISGSKTWEDKANQDGIRPESITINLLANGTKVESKTVTAADRWEWTFTNLLKYDENGADIVYTIEEEQVTGYTAAVVGYDVTNTHTPEAIEVSGSKTWEDNNNQDNIRPESITINLLADGEFVDNAVVEEDAEGNWEWTFTNLPKYKAGKEIVYTIEEETVTGYTAKVSGYNVTNTHTPATTEVSGSKTWYDNDNQNQTRPQSITINLLANGTKVDSKTVTAADNWVWSFTNLPKNENGRPIAYTIEEEQVRGYISEVDGYNVTNTYTTDITVNKIWEDEENQANSRPANIQIQLYKTLEGETAATSMGEEYKITLTSGTDSNWATKELTYTWEDLPKYENGKEITYTVQEATEVPGYQAVYSNDTFTITNIYKAATTSVTITKVWDTPHVLNHPDMTVNLYQNGDETAAFRTATLSAGEDEIWQVEELSYTWNDLPKYKVDANGDLIITNGAPELNVYTVEEIGELIQYNTTYSDGIMDLSLEGDNTGDTIITNQAKGIVETVTYQTQETTYTKPVDVVLVLDTSGSMAQPNSQGNSKAKDMVAAVNETIATVMSHNSNSRIAIVTYSNSASTILPLAHYTPNSEGQYLTCSQGNYIYSSGKYSNVSISTNVQELTNQNEVEVTGATYIQGGIALGTSILTGAETKYDPDGAEGPEPETTRIPILLLLSDGEPTKHTTSYNNVNVTSPTGGNGSTATYTDAYYTIRTADYYKTLIQAHYGEAHMYTIGYGVDTLLIRTVLNPNKANVDECGLSGKNTNAKKLYNALANTTEGVYGFDYADGSYTSGTMSSSELAILLNKFIHSSIPSTTYRIFTKDEITAKKVYLNNIDATDGFALTYGSTQYLELSDAIADGIVVQEGTNYYVDLNKIWTNAGATEQVYLKYHEKKKI